MTTISKLLLMLFGITLAGKASAQCFLPDPPKNGEIIYATGSDVNASIVENSGIVRYQCNKGYRLTGNQVNFCNHGNWTSKPAECSRISCRPPPKSKYGTWIALTRREGEQATLVCDEGYEISGESSLLCKREGLELTWEGNSPKCNRRKKCPNPGTPMNSTRHGKCCYTGDVVHFECHDGFRLVGDDELVCKQDETWTSQRPRCKPPATCPDPPEVAFGKIESSTKNADYFQPWDDALVKCDEGYRAVDGSDYLFCLDDLTWESDFAVCEEIFCQLPNIPEHVQLDMKEGLANTSVIPYAAEVNFRCDPGFRLVGNSWISCTENGWSHSLPACKEITCGHPGIPENGNIVGSSFRVGAEVTFSCFSGFTLIGNSVRKCLSNGVWSGERAICDTGKSLCPNPGEPQYGRKIGSRYEGGDVIKFSCKKHYTLVGQKVIQCMHNGSWNGTTPKCEGVMEFERPEDVSFRILLALDQKRVLQDSRKAKMNQSKSERTLSLNVPHNLVLYFVLDSSRSVGETNFNISLEFVKVLVRRTGVSPQGVRVGVVTYGSNVTTIFNPLQYSSTSDVLRALGKIRYTKGGTATNKALEEIRWSIYPLVKANLPKAKSVIFLITDGKFNMGGNPEVTAKALKNNGFEIYCIGVSGNLNVNSLKRVSSSENKHTFILHGYDTLQWVVDELLNGSVDYSRCGISYRQVQETAKIARVLGGNTVVKQWPWIAALFIKYSDIAFHKLLCGGSLIDRQWILTAAHCVIPETSNKTLRNSDVIIRLGVTDINKITYQEEFAPMIIIPHPQFSRHRDYLKNDIALIKLSRPVKYTEHIRPICLPPNYSELESKTVLYKANQRATAMGWGYDKKLQIDESVQIGVSVLKEVSISIQSKETCEESLKGVDFDSEMFCAGDKTGVNDTCEGDSGGPLMQSLGPEYTAEHYWVQVGIISWGRGCGQPGLYGVYTNVAKFVDWVSNTKRTN